MVIGWKQIDDSWYYFNEKGYAVSGWQLINNNWYYFDPLNSNMHTGWLKNGCPQEESGGIAIVTEVIQHQIGNGLTESGTILMRRAGW